MHREDYILVACNLRMSYESSDLCLYNIMQTNLIIQLDQLAVMGVTIIDN